MFMEAKKRKGRQKFDLDLPSLSALVLLNMRKRVCERVTEAIMKVGLPCGLIR